MKPKRGVYDCPKLRVPFQRPPNVRQTAHRDVSFDFLRGELFNAYRGSQVELGKLLILSDPAADCQLSEIAILLVSMDRFDAAGAALLGYFVEPVQQGRYAILPEKGIGSRAGEAVLGDVGKIVDHPVGETALAGAQSPTREAENDGDRRGRDKAFS